MKIKTLIIAALAATSLSFSAFAEEPATTGTSETVDKIGVPECDDFLTKYEACVVGKVPEANREQYKTMIQQWRTSWKQLAANEQTKASLINACKQAHESAKQTTAAYGCTW